MLACEARDSDSTNKFDILRRRYGDTFLDFIMTAHELVPGERIGKHSNENHTCKELYKYAQKKTIDPFNIMVTICDADSIFHSIPGTT